MPIFLAEQLVTKRRLPQQPPHQTMFPGHRPGALQSCVQLLTDGQEPSLTTWAWGAVQAQLHPPATWKMKNLATYSRLPHCPDILLNILFGHFYIVKNYFGFSFSSSNCFVLKITIVEVFCNRFVAYIQRLRWIKKFLLLFLMLY